MSSTLLDTMEYAISSKLNIFQVKGYMNLEFIKAILPGDDFLLFL